MEKHIDDASVVAFTETSDDDDTDVRSAAKNLIRVADVDSSETGADCDNGSDSDSDSAFGHECGNMMKATLTDPAQTNQPETVFEFIETKCKGTAKMFTIPDNNVSRLEMKVISRRMKYDPSCQVVTFLETRSLPAKSLKDMCHDVMIAFREGGTAQWKLGIIELLQYKVEREDNSLADGVLYLHEWTVASCVSSNNRRLQKHPSKPALFESKSWSDCVKHVRKRMFVLGEDDIEVVFVNQVMGPSHKGAYSDTVNLTDSAVQSSRHGPDRFVPPCPPIGLGFLMKTEPHRGINLLEKDYYLTRSNGSYIVKSLSNRKTHENPYVKKFLNFGVCLIDETTKTNYVVIKNRNGDHVDLRDMQKKTQEMDNMLLVPSLCDSVNKSNPCSFFLIHPKKLKELRKSVHGVRRKDAVQFFDSEVREF